METKKYPDSRFCITYVKENSYPAIGLENMSNKNEMDPYKHGLPLHLPLLTETSKVVHDNGT